MKDLGEDALLIRKPFHRLSASISHQESLMGHAFTLMDSHPYLAFLAIWLIGNLIAAAFFAAIYWRRRHKVLNFGDPQFPPMS